jgi:hypothetical protein
MDEADQLAHDIVVFDHGRVVATGAPDLLKAKTGGQVLQVAPADPARMAEVTALMTELIRGEVGTDAESSPASKPAGTTRPAFSASKVSKTATGGRRHGLGAPSRPAPEAGPVAQYPARSASALADRPCSGPTLPDHSTRRITLRFLVVRF